MAIKTHTNAYTHTDTHTARLCLSCGTKQQSPAQEASPDLEVSPSAHTARIRKHFPGWGLLAESFFLADMLQPPRLIVGRRRWCGGGVGVGGGGGSPRLQCEKVAEC